MARSNFTGSLIVEHLSPKPLHWRLYETLYYERDYEGSGKWIDVPKGYETDGASIPRLFWWFLWPTGRYFRGAAVHDQLYRYLRDGTPHIFALERKHADKILREAARACGCSQPTCWTLWIAVRLWGWTYLRNAKPVTRYVHTDPPPKLKSSSVEEPAK